MSDSTEVNNSVPDDNVSLDSYTFVAVPASGDTSDYQSGTYIRLGSSSTDSTENSSYYPEPYTALSSPPEANGLFLKTDGVLFQTIRGGAYEEFDDVLSIYVKEDYTLQSNENVYLKGPQVDIIADASINSESNVNDPGKVSVTASDSVDITANGGDIVMTAKGSVKTTVQTDRKLSCGGTWKSYGGGTKYSYFKGSTIGFFIGDAVNVFVGLDLTVVNMFSRVTIGFEFVVYGFGRLVFGAMDIKKCSTNILMVDVEVKNSTMNVYRHTITMRQSNLGVGAANLRVGNDYLNLKKQNLNMWCTNVVNCFM